MKKWSSDPLGFGGHGSHPFHSGWRWTHHTKKGHQNYQVLYKSWRFFPKLEASATFASHKKRRYLNLMKSWFPPKKNMICKLQQRNMEKLSYLKSTHILFVLALIVFCGEEYTTLYCIPDVWYMYIYVTPAAYEPVYRWRGHSAWWFPSGTQVRGGTETADLRNVDVGGDWNQWRTPRKTNGCPLKTNCWKMHFLLK